CTGPSHLRSRWDSQCPRGRDSPSLQAFGRPSVRWKMALREGEVKSNGGWLFEADSRLGRSRQWAYVVHGAVSDSPTDASRLRPDLVIGVMGCMAQLHQGAIQRRAPSVDLVFGSPAIARVAELVDQVRRERRPVLETGEGPLVKITARPPAAGRLKAFVTVMEGCEKHCTFCVVPQTRGRERSHPPDVIVDEVSRLAAEGCREVTLLGQTVNAYGRDLTPATDLGELFERVGEVEEIARIRFTTSNPYNLTPTLIRAMRDVPKVCEYFHLPLQ